MPASWPLAAAGVFGLVLLFVLAITVGLRVRASRIAEKLRELTADAVWRELVATDPSDGSRYARSDLLYGIWEDFSATRNGMAVRDSRDEVVARIEYSTFAAGMTVGSEGYRVATDAFSGRATLIRDGAPGGGSAAVCEFERTSGPLGLPPYVGRYRSPQEAIEVEVDAPLRSPLRSRPLEIARNGERIGALFQIGAPIFNEGRAVVLPSGLPLPLRVFVLAWSLGGRTSA